MSKRPLQLVFDILPSRFTRKDLSDALKRHHRKYNPEGALQRFKVQGLIRPTGLGDFAKL